MTQIRNKVVFAYVMVSVSVVLAVTLVMALTFGIALRSSEMSVLVTINEHGEAWIEAVLLLLALPGGIVWIWCRLCDRIKEFLDVSI